MEKTLEQMSLEEKLRIAETSSDGDVLDLLANDESPVVRVIVAGNENAPRKALMKLAEDSNGLIRFAVSQNPNAPADILMKLEEDENESVRIEAAGRSGAWQIAKETENTYLKQSSAICVVGISEACKKASAEKLAALSGPASVYGDSCRFCSMDDKHEAARQAARARAVHDRWEAVTDAIGLLIKVRNELESLYKPEI